MKDDTSYKAHDKGYKENPSIEETLKVLKKYNDLNAFKLWGFEEAVGRFEHRDLHVDVGSGSGWLLLKTAPLFKKTIAAEPSLHGIDISKQILKDVSNAEIIHADMIEIIHIIKKRGVKTPIFFTTAAVLTHIKDFYVKEFLHALHDMPDGSTFFFDERYDKNVQQKLWHIRRKYWWAQHLPGWEISFFDIRTEGYKSGIYGEKVGRANVSNTYRPTKKDTAFWFLDGIRNKYHRLVRNAKRTIRKFSDPR